VTESRLQEIATDATALTARIQANESYGKTDLQELVSSLLSLRAGEAILDVGCGTGKFLVRFAATVGSGGRAVGVDLDEAGLAEADARCRKQGLAVSLVHGSMDEVRTLVAGQRFDAICCCYALYYAQDAAAVIQQMAGLLEPDGRLLVAGPDRGNNAELLDLVRDAGAQVAPAVDQGFMAETVAPTCRRLFQEVTQTPFENAVGFPSTEAVLEYWRSTAYFDPALESSLRGILDDHFRDHAEFANVKRGSILLARRLN
jgi:ubiquinone/menaquinone biosynthesis C-methylase UbiE